MTFEFDFIIVGLMQIIGFFVEGCAGFGCTVIAAPLVTSILGTAEGVPYGTLMAIPFLYILVAKSIHEISWKDLVKILAACIPGLLVGNWLFYRIDASTAKICIGAVVTVIATMNIYKHIIRPLVLKKVDETDAPDTIGKKIFRYTCLIAGGIVHGAFNIGGPLITVYTLEAVKDKRKFRNTMASLWAILNTINAYSQYSNGAWNPHLWSALLVGYPMAAIGFYFGVKFLDKINRAQFLRIVYVILFAIGIDMLVRNILAVI